MRTRGFILLAQALFVFTAVFAGLTGYAEHNKHKAEQQASQAQKK